MKPIRILLVDDDLLIRAAVRVLLEKMSGIEVVAEADNGRQAVELVEAHNPDIVLSDILMPEMNGLEAMERILSHHPRIRFILLSVMATEESVHWAVKAGAAGYLLKNSPPNELEQAIRAVDRGETFLTPAVARLLVTAYRDGKTETPAHEKLTQRQREILQLVAEGNTTKEIARKLGISVKTAESHRAQLMHALDIHEIAGLVRYAMRTGLVPPER